MATPHCNLYRSLSIILLCLLLPLPALAERPDGSTQPPNPDVTFIVSGKVVRYKQDEHGKQTFWHYLGFSEIFLTREGQVSDAYLITPGKNHAPRPFKFVRNETPLVNDYWKVEEEFSSREALDERWPEGDYHFKFRSPGGDIDDAIVNLHGGKIPPLPQVTMRQDEEIVSIRNIDPDKDLIVTWTPFTQGASDERGILDDMMFVVADSCVLMNTIHSGRPFEDTDLLYFDDTEYRISASALEPGQTYTMFVDYADLVDTRRDVGAGIVGMSVYSATTYLELQTTGKAKEGACPNG